MPVCKGSQWFIFSIPTHTNIRPLDCYYRHLKNESFYSFISSLKISNCAFGLENCSRELSGAAIAETIRRNGLQSRLTWNCRVTGRKVARFSASLSHFRVWAGRSSMSGAYRANSITLKVNKLVISYVTAFWANSTILSLISGEEILTLLDIKDNFYRTK